MKQWLTEENLAATAEYLSACQNMEMFSSLWEIYKKPVIIAAIERLTADKRDQINQWFIQLDDGGKSTIPNLKSKIV
ncbi:hypothetical protein [Nodularia sp. NIES-3585]|uniref:hypothetical protein n=1 Tax=Nodularia sp. NIES-3585 TaxID=1973477 RepID=UPI000B5CBB4E|nr:hypothetical protein [Nodularia sp. NIES-3585]GAX38601.1 putative helicase [Nodularia sp. NIES-3585]